MKVNIADTEHLGENWGWHKCDLLPLEVEFNSMNSQLQKTQGMTFEDDGTVGVWLVGGLHNPHQKSGQDRIFILGFPKIGSTIWTTTR